MDIACFRAAAPARGRADLQGRFKGSTSSNIEVFTVAPSTLGTVLIGICSRRFALEISFNTMDW